MLGGGGACSEAPLSFSWLADNTLVVFVRAASGAGSVKLIPPAADAPIGVWPTQTRLPGTLVDRPRLSMQAGTGLRDVFRAALRERFADASRSTSRILRQLSS